MSKMSINSDCCRGDKKHDFYEKQIKNTEFSTEFDTEKNDRTEKQPIG